MVSYVGQDELGRAVHDHILNSMLLISIEEEKNRQINGFFTHNNINHIWRHQPILVHIILHKPQLEQIAQNFAFLKNGVFKLKNKKSCSAGALLKFL